MTRNEIEKRAENFTDDFNEFGLMVTSNAGKSHILFGSNYTSPCGIKYMLTATKNPMSEIRWYMDSAQFKIWVQKQRFELGASRLCKRCLSEYDKLKSLKIKP